MTIAESTTGAMPATGATPETDADVDPKPATGEGDLGDAGKRALHEEREGRSSEKRRADAAEAELTRMREATSSESEKLIHAAKREAAAEERAKWQERFRSAEVRGALRGAGIVNDRMLSLAIAAPEFAALTVTDDGAVTGVSEAVDAFKAAMPEAFAQKEQPRTNGTVRTGVQTPPSDPDVKPGYERLQAAYAAAAPKK